LKDRNLDLLNITKQTSTPTSTERQCDKDDLK